MSRTMFDFRWTRVFNFILGLLVSCSLLTLFWTFRLGTEGDRFNPEDSSSVYRFQSTFKLQEMSSKKQQDIVTNLKLDIDKLKEELTYSQRALYEIEQLGQGKDMESLIKAKCRNQHGIPACQVLHIAIVCAGYTESRRVVTLIKSLLFYRKHPLHIHFIVDDHSKLVLQTLFKTWQLQQVLLSFYDTESLKSSIDWIPNKHYSGIYGLMKLTLTQALSESLDKVIVLDTDVFFVDNVANLWAQFELFSKDQAIGLVENQSEWYLGKLWKHYKPWPALGRGFNTGVILLDLRKLRKMRWTDTWRLTAEKQLMNLLATALADQDVINAVIAENPSIVYKLPCTWNIQLSEHTQSEKCYEKVTELKLIHWNSPQKSKVMNKHGDYFRSMYLTFLQYDGNLLKRDLFVCEIENPSIKPAHVAVVYDKVDECGEFRTEQSLIRRVHLYFLDFKLTMADNDVTLLIHLSVDRMQILESVLDHWEGPISLALYVTDADAQQFLKYAQKSSQFNKRSNVGVHLVYKDGEFYPVNYLRNIALEQVQTPHVFLSDVDFLPMPHLYNYLRSQAAAHNMDKKALVVPAFETYRYKMKFPQSKSELLPLLENKQVSVFREDVWPQGHGPTNSKYWKTAVSAYKVDWQQDYEPYILVKKKSLPFYDLRFIGFGWNKVSQIMELRAQGYQFHVLPDAFIIHMPHAPSFDITKFRSNSIYRSCLQQFKEEFRQDMQKRYSIMFN